jgi:hemolysin-activating ACP:hemolysin acyltransferase
MTKLQNGMVVQPEVRIVQHSDRNAAIGLAVCFVASKGPFASYPASRLVSSIVGQIERRHYAFAVHEGRVVGYIGWALCTNTVAEAWLAEGRTPTSEQCRNGEVVVPIIVVTEDSFALRPLIAFVSNHYPGFTYVARRILPAGGSTRRGRIKGVAAKRKAYKST